MERGFGFLCAGGFARAFCFAEEFMSDRFDRLKMEVLEN